MPTRTQTYKEYIRILRSLYLDDEIILEPEIRAIRNILGLDFKLGEVQPGDYIVFKGVGQVDLPDLSVGKRYKVHGLKFNHIEDDVHVTIVNDLGSKVVCSWKLFNVKK